MQELNVDDQARDASSPRARGRNTTASPHRSPTRATGAAAPAPPDPRAAAIAAPAAGRAHGDGDARLRTLLATTPAGIAVLDLEGRCLEVNGTLCRLLARDAAAMAGASWPDLAHPDDADAAGRLVQDARDGRRDAAGQRLRFARADGSITWADASVAAVAGDGGSPVELVAQLVDVTAQVAAEEALRATEQRYRALVGEIDGVVFVQDVKTGSAFCSGQVNELLGYSAEAMVLPGAWRRLVVEEDAEWVIAIWDGQQDRDEDVLEYRMRRADGAVIWVEERWRAIRDEDGSIARWSSVVTDITSRRRLDETVSRTDRLEAVSRVAAAAAHDFGDVLARVQLAQGNLADALTATDPRAADVHEIGEAVRHGIQLTRQLLAFSRDRDEAEAAPLDVAWLLTDLEPILRGVAGPAELSIRVIANGLTRVTRSALEQAILNLVINARDATPPGGRIRIAVDREQVTADAGLGIRPGPYLALAVEDTGTGMPLDVQQRAFDPFFTTKPHGSGLGLPSVFGTMRAVGGTVRVDSRVGEGTRIWLLMPEAAPAATDGIATVTR